MSTPDNPRVLIVTDSLLSIKEPSALAALRKQLKIHRTSVGAWLDLRLKILTLERVLPARLHGVVGNAKKSPHGQTVAGLMTEDINLGAPELTEVVLMTLLAAEHVSFEATTYAILSADAKVRKRLLNSCDLVLASSTMLRGLPEVRAIASLLKRDHNKVVMGGALAAVLHADWPGVPGIDCLAVGYGEWLVPAIVQWMRSGYTHFEPPPRGRVVTRAGTPILYSGLPQGKNLDELVRPDWSLAEQYHGRSFPMVHYESVRGCPYRCQFCNYPYLFDDTKFRYKSAERIADDWAAYAAGGAKIVNCLDSLFTMPRKRLMALCDLLIERDLGIEWICYARADDLVKPGTVEAMRKAGCIQVQIGIESGDQQILDNMDKRVTVATNLEAMKRCAEGGISTLVSVIVGYPGETEATVQATLDHLRAGQPDFYYAAPFSVQLDDIPVMQEPSVSKFELESNPEASSIRYWRHKTMDCAQTVNLVADFNDTMMREGVSAEASIFYPAIPKYRRDTHRADLIAWQKEAAVAQPLLRRVFRGVGRWAQGRLEKDFVHALDHRSP